MKFQRQPHQMVRAINTFSEEFMLIVAGAGTRDGTGKYSQTYESPRVESGSFEPVTEMEEALTLVPDGLKIKDMKWIFVSRDLGIKAMSADEGDLSSGDFVLYPKTNGRQYKVLSVTNWGDHKRALIARITNVPEVNLNG